MLALYRKNNRNLLCKTLPVCLQMVIKLYPGVFSMPPSDALRSSIEHEES